ADKHYNIMSTSAYRQQNTSDLSARIIFTIVVLAICRFGSFVPVAGIDSAALEALTQQTQSGILGMFNMLSGGSLNRMSIFALAAMPYITASIRIQLMSIADKTVENLKTEGASGRRKTNQLPRYLTVILAAFQAYGRSATFLSAVTPLGPVVVIPPT